MHQQGLVHPFVVTSVVLTVLVVTLGGVSIWAFVNYQDQKNNVDTKIEAAVAAAKQEQSEEDDKLFAEREKQPARQLVGPDDLGHVTFDYPKTWSVYIEKDGSEGEYDAYLHPGAVVALANDQPSALHVSILKQDYDTVVKKYREAVTKGDLKATPVNLQGQTGTRLDGAFSKERQGSMVLMKLRDKTIVVATENKDFVNDFNAIVLPSLKFNP